MICRCFGRSFDLSAVAVSVGKTAYAVAGLPDYEAYLAHAASRHPDESPMTRAAFFADRQAARYGAGGLRCC